MGLERDLKQDIQLSNSFAQAVGGFVDLARDWVDIQTALRNLPGDDLSAGDHRKLELWGKSMRIDTLVQRLCDANAVERASRLPGGHRILKQVALISEGRR